MSLKVLTWVAVSALLLALSGCLRARLKPGVESPIVLTTRLAMFGLVGVILLGLAAHFGYAPSLQVYMQSAGSRLGDWAQRCGSPF